MVVRKAERRRVPKGQLPAFTPVPRKQPRHDGWTPERQKAFIEALADTGCVAIACRMVNMSQPSFYYLRRQPGAESFRAAADAAQTLGLQPVKDEAFDRAMNGELIPVFVAGKLMGFRRKKNDRLLMFILRHYGEDAAGRRTTINYFSTRATAGAAAAQNSSPGFPGQGDQSRTRSGDGEGAGSTAAGAAAESSTTTVKTVITGNPGQSTTLARENDATALINAFEGVELDAHAQAEIRRTLEACAERRRALEADPEHDPERLFIGEEETNGYLGQLESGIEGDWIEYRPDADPELGLGREHRWESLGEGGQAAEIDRVVAEMQARLAAESPEDRATREAAQDAMSRAAFAKANLPLPGYLGASPALPAPVLSEDEGPEPDADDPRLDWRNWQTGSYADPSDSPRTGEGDRPSKADGGGADAPASEQLPPPSRAVEGTRAKAGAKPRKTYKKRSPKPRFVPPDDQQKAKAIADVAEERREAAAAEAERRKRRRPNGIERADP